MTDYEKHMNFLASALNPKYLSECAVNEQFQVLLSILPNDGKLYKYRSLIGESFENIYNSLDQGYMWIGTASCLNDDSDSILICDVEKETLKFMDYLFSNPLKLIYAIFKNQGIDILASCEELKNMPVNEMLDCFDPKTKQLNTLQASNLLARYCDDPNIAFECAKNIDEQIKKAIREMGTPVKQFVKTLYQINENMRSGIHIFSMSESYDLSNMWGYYADSGKGFCIEYDYQRAQNLDFQSKWWLLNTAKVEYDDSPVKLDWGDIVENSVLENKDVSTESFQKSILKQALRKEKCWEHEQEWRITLSGIDNKLPIDIVSGVIIDERSIDTQNAQRLIELCKKRNWFVKIRKRNIVHSNHYYSDYSI